MVLAVIYSGAALLNSDVRRSYVECDSNFALLLKRMSKNIRFVHVIYMNNKNMRQIQENYVTFCHSDAPIPVFASRYTMKRCIYSVMINF